MPIGMNFQKQKITVIGFQSRDDFAGFMRKMDELFNRTKRYPMFYVLTDPATTEEDLSVVQNFIQDMVQKTDDVKMVKSNLDKGRFPEITN